MLVTLFVVVFIISLLWSSTKGPKNFSPGFASFEREQWRSQRRFTLHHFWDLGFGRKTHEFVVPEEAHSLTYEIVFFKGALFIIEKMVELSSFNITWCLLGEGGSRFQKGNRKLKQLVTNIKRMAHSVKAQD